MTYERRQTPQLEILEIVHLTSIFIGFYILEIPVLRTSLTAVAPCSLDGVVHAPRKRVDRVAIGAGEIFQNCLDRLVRGLT